MTGSGDDALVQMRKMARRSFALGRRWMLRSVVLLLIAFIAFRRQGQLMTIIGMASLLLAVLSFSLGQSMRRNARHSMNKLDLMEKTTAGGGPRPAGGA